tara:strand:+ start:3200 stop:3808 length:609 start_codon:yes stop_codon:yes gene_type:complete
MADIAKQSVLNKSRLDKFLLSLTVPEGLKTYTSRVQRATGVSSYSKVIPNSLQYSVEGTVVPAINVPAIDQPYDRQVMKVSTHSRPAYEDVTVSFKIDNQFNNYWYIYSWLNMISDAKHGAFNYRDELREKHGSKREKDYLADYATDFSLIGMNEYNKEIIKFTYTKAFPVSLGGISYNYQTQGEIQSSITFTFTQMLVELV